MQSTVTTRKQKIIPLWARVHVGPIVAYFFYFFYFYIKRTPLQPHILSIEETLHRVIKNNLSVIRFGDGEISLINNTDLAFQNKNIELSKKLQQILQIKHEKLLICILNIWGKNIKKLEKKVYWFELHHLLKYHKVWERLVSNQQTYGDAFITRPYLTIRDKKRSENIFKLLRKVWEDKKVILIEGEKARTGVGNDLFSCTKSLKRILCPAENAFSKYEEIKKECLKVPKDSLVLISLGPTAKVLAYEMFLLGYQVIDIGHTDMEYEMFLRRETALVKVPYKYFNEIGERNPEDCTDTAYTNQILAKIT